MSLYDNERKATRGVRNREHTSGVFTDFIHTARVTNNITFKDSVEVTRSSDHLLAFYLQLHDEIGRNPGKANYVVKRAIDTSRMNSTSKRTLAIAKSIENLSEIASNSALQIQKELLDRVERTITDLRKKATTYYDNSKYITKFGKTVFTGSDFNDLAREILERHEIDFIERKIALLEARAKELWNKKNPVVAIQLSEEASALKEKLSQLQNNKAQNEDPVENE